MEEGHPATFERDERYNITYHLVWVPNDHLNFIAFKDKVKKGHYTEYVCVINFPRTIPSAPPTMTTGPHTTNHTNMSSLPSSSISSSANNSSLISANPSAPAQAIVNPSSTSTSGSLPLLSANAEPASASGDLLSELENSDSRTSLVVSKLASITSLPRTLLHVAVPVRSPKAFYPLFYLVQPHLPRLELTKEAAQETIIRILKDRYQLDVSAPESTEVAVEGNPDGVCFALFVSIPGADRAKFREIPQEPTPPDKLRPWFYVCQGSYSEEYE